METPKWLLLVLCFLLTFQKVHSLPSVRTLRIVKDIKLQAADWAFGVFDFLQNEKDQSELLKDISNELERITEDLQWDILHSLQLNKI